jgi:hypothetical protein
VGGSLPKLNLTAIKGALKNRYLIAFLIILVVLPMVVFAVAAPVRTGTKTVCKYNHPVSDDTRTILVWRWTAGDYGVKTKTVTCAKHRRLESLLRQAQKARDKKDYKRAQELVNEIKKADPAFQAGAVATIEADIGIATGGSTGGTTGPGDTPGTTPGGSTPDYSGELAGLFPKTLAGYTQINDSPGQLTASRMYSADAAAHPNVYLLTIQISRAATSETAKDYINSYVKAYYASGAKSLKVGGKDAYFGTDGGELAILAYPAGTVVVELEMSAIDKNGAGLYDTLVTLSKQVP